MMLIYSATNTVTGMKYYGRTKHSLAHRKSQHERSRYTPKSEFHRAMNEYGLDSFEWNEEIICNNEEASYRLEQMCISMWEPEQLYNRSAGGKYPAYGMRHSDKTKEICGEYAKQRWDGKRAADKYPEWVFLLTSYKEASQFGVPKTTWYRQRGKRTDLTN
jgi:hypothetical protein